MAKRNEDTDNEYNEDYDDSIMGDFIENDNDNDDDDDEEQKPKPKKERPKKRSRLIGKHTLANDTIFGHKKNTTEEEYESEHFIKNAGGSLDVNEDMLDNEESRNNIDYFRDTRLKKEVNKALIKYTDLDFLAPRRKPSKSDFNAYFNMLLVELHQFGYTKTEIFMELVGYFSDNYWNIFKLLDNKYSNIIIKELKEKYGLKDVDELDIF
jgi:hypothetical protein